MQRQLRTIGVTKAPQPANNLPDSDCVEPDDQFLHRAGLVL